MTDDGQVGLDMPRTRMDDGQVGSDVPRTRMAAGGMGTVEARSGTLDGPPGFSRSTQEEKPGLAGCGFGGLVPDPGSSYLAVLSHRARGDLRRIATRETEPLKSHSPA